ncbi:hypothetical protein [Actinomadura parmotrematis]|uniref:Tat pathway signal sequence domain protein n=1 Tax=Actinomadura parmotrematis TaxID=2864039 RepID=A0ABS7FSY6_9ACTN|nr:hypothetical protein [Actinomadura parmotrematis]MBW8483508.1 hypothetical protein [Actinomadura parmotrematis]
MAHIRQSIAVGTALLAPLAVLAPAADAATTTIRRGTATAAAYSGSVRASLLGTASVSTSIGTGSCNQSTLTGSIQSNGTALSITAASITNNPGPACPGTGGTIAVTTQNLPWTGGSVVYDSAHTGGRDAAVTIAGFKVKAVASILGGITCYYGGSLTANGYNPDNAARPNTSVAQAEVGVNGATVSKQSGSSFLCPSTATVTATYQLQGETTAGSGVFDQKLYVTS